jgi:hypothetical protein
LAVAFFIERKTISECLVVAGSTKCRYRSHTQERAGQFAELSQVVEKWQRYFRIFLAISIFCSFFGPIGSIRKRRHAIGSAGCAGKAKKGERHEDIGPKRINSGSWGGACVAKRMPDLGAGSGYYGAFAVLLASSADLFCAIAAVSVAEGIEEPGRRGQSGV